MHGVCYHISLTMEVSHGTHRVHRNNRNQAFRLPKDFEFQGVTELTIKRQGDTILLRPVRPDWLSLMEEPPAAADFLGEPT